MLSMSMSRIFDVSSVKAITQEYWRRFAGLVTGFAHRYRDDSFLRTEVSIVALEVGYAILVTAISIAALSVLYNQVVQGITGAIASILTSPHATFSPEAISHELEAMRTREIVSLAGLILVTAAVFGYLVTRFALAPARNALAAQKRFIGNIEPGSAKR